MQTKIIDRAFVYLPIITGVVGRFSPFGRG
jgi:hypothetical protein